MVQRNNSGGNLQVEIGSISQDLIGRALYTYFQHHKLGNK